MKLDKNDLTNLASFFSEYIRDDNEIDPELEQTLNKIFKITNWFDD